MKTYLEAFGTFSIYPTTKFLYACGDNLWPYAWDFCRIMYFNCSCTLAINEDDSQSRTVQQYTVIESKTQDRNVSYGVNGYRLEGKRRPNPSGLRSAGRVKSFSFFDHCACRDFRIPFSEPPTELFLDPLPYKLSAHQYPGDACLRLPKTAGSDDDQRMNWSFLL